MKSEIDTNQIADSGSDRRRKVMREDYEEMKNLLGLE